MNKNSLVTAKSFFKMAECDRKLLVVTRVISAVLTVSLLIKLAVSSVLFCNSFATK